MKNPTLFPSADNRKNGRTCRIDSAKLEQKEYHLSNFYCLNLQRLLDLLQIRKTGRPLHKKKMNRQDIKNEARNNNLNKNCSTDI